MTPKVGFHSIQYLKLCPLQLKNSHQPPLNELQGEIKLMEHNTNYEKRGFPFSGIIKIDYEYRIKGGL